MKKLLTIPSGPRAKWVVLAVWLLTVFAFSAASLPSKFEEIQENDSASFLPADAESTKALEATKEIQGAENVTIVAVYRRDGGLTAADKRQIAEDRAELNALRLGAPSRSRRRASRRTAARRCCSPTSPRTASPTRSSIRSRRCASGSATRAAGSR